jgi:hypothetical protein
VELIPKKCFFGVTATKLHGLTVQPVPRPIVGGNKASIRDFPHQVCYADGSHQLIHQFIYNFIVCERSLSQEC